MQYRAKDFFLYNLDHNSNKNTSYCWVRYLDFSFFIKKLPGDRKVESVTAPVYMGMRFFFFSF